MKFKAKWILTEIKMVFSSVLVGADKGNLSVVATVFDKLNQVYKEYLDAEQAYTTVSMNSDFKLHVIHVCLIMLFC